MRLATAADELLPMKDPRVQANPAYAVILILSRVIVRLGTLQPVSAEVVEGLFSADLAYLQEFYNQINQVDCTEIPVTCPKCHHKFSVAASTYHMPKGRL